MDLNDIKAVYFIGIGGIGMSAIARYFLSKETTNIYNTEAKNLWFQL